MRMKGFEKKQIGFNIHCRNSRAKCNFKILLGLRSERSFFFWIILNQAGFFLYTNRKLFCIDEKKRIFQQEPNALVSLWIWKYRKNGEKIVVKINICSCDDHQICHKTVIFMSDWLQVGAIWMLLQTWQKNCCNFPLVSIENVPFKIIQSHRTNNGWILKNKCNHKWIWFLFHANWKTNIFQIIAKKKEKKIILKIEKFRVHQTVYPVVKPTW